MPAEAKIPKSITPWITVLSLVVQEPDTVAGVSRRLKEQFPAAHFPESSAHNNIRSLVKAGYLRLVEEGRGPTLNRYEATDAGNDASCRWLLSALPPTMRDSLQGKLAFVGCEQIAALIELVGEEERAFRREFDRLQGRWMGHKRFRSDLAEVDWQAELQAIRLKDEAEWFGEEVMRRKKRVAELEELLLSLRGG
jgi:DNA-binding PadR family transcriptional regulator